MKHVAAVLLICHVGAAPAADSLGRLFFTQQQRAQLDTARKQQGHKPIIAATAEEPLPATVITYSGVVRRSDGHSTVWINNRAVHDRSHADSTEPRARVDDTGAASISLPQQQRSVRLKVGQTAEVVSGHVVESYERRQPAPRIATPAPPAAEPVLRLRRKYDREPDVPAADSIP